MDRKIIKGKSLQEVKPHTKYMACTFYLDYVDGEDLQNTEFDNCSFRGSFRDWGRDEYGLWMAICYKNVRQVMRWIRPGTFMMGSPNTEEYRLGNEQHHQVTLSKGFWLAETVCTQDLWTVVMEKNPSKFQGKSRPVERVSWNDCRMFIGKWNHEVPEWELCLPTEAQWEYACRAGTTTAFSFGETITQNQVHYDAKRTAVVKALLCNDWGLYGMHGNVWEWCEDWYTHHHVTTTNSLRAPDGSERVIRGGGWLNSPNSLRSACRYSCLPNVYNDDIGFRFCLRSKK
ncbi:formylglycine-generating enzyme family protein [Candidatus Uabimicrobium amorphum]|uniref:Sulfatase-modifying factor enzyme-like domain-containing protein n=1 Tax=Uabimicrobium amorphum TaxID=2596890 RepID=A0A5S9IQE4_UABAM|nr:formylglycine-generating enzyme family protein [Candidatus Uabimicrobium amorphum]BBM85797.1 hypothetical protein UABAM_04175 [Candidatus Uabimicrobium amorphum]